MAQRYYKIGEFARRIGVSCVTLRTWDERGLLVPHHVSPSGYRYYSEEQLQKYLGSKSRGREIGGDADDRSG